MSAKRLDAWLSRQGYAGGKTGTALHAKFLAAPAGIRGSEADARAVVTLALVAAIDQLNIQIADIERRILTDLEHHPDAHVFTSLPKGGTIRAATVLAEIGDARGRFPTDDALAALAGAAPSTRSSGKLHSVTFRFACDKKLRDAIVNFADDSRHASPWAADIYQRARDRGHRHPPAVRILARAWIRVIWRCWQNETAPPTTPHATAALNNFLTRQLDTGLLNRGGNRQLNKVLHTAAKTQARIPGPGRDYCQRRRGEGKTTAEALRALKRHISNAVYRTMQADARARADRRTACRRRTHEADIAPVRGPAQASRSSHSSDVTSVSNPGARRAGTSACPKPAARNCHLHREASAMRTRAGDYAAAADVTRSSTPALAH